METENIKKTTLFKGMSEEDIKKSLSELSGTEQFFKKNTIILQSGDTTDRMGLVLSGSVTIESNDVWGNCTILSHIATGQFFAETYAILPESVMLVDVRANEDCNILFLKIGSLLSDNSSAPWRKMMLKNLLMITAQKNLTLSGRSFHTSPKNARNRILAYLNTISIQKNSSEFDIPFDRQQLADYLNLERTNMSKELGRMQSDGIIEFRKNHFKLIG